MNKAVFSYIKTHTMLIMTVVVGIFLILAGGEYILYRRVMQLNSMLSEGLIQLKENKEVDIVVPPTKTSPAINLR